MTCLINQTTDVDSPYKKSGYVPIRHLAEALAPLIPVWDLAIVQVRFFVRCTDLPFIDSPLCRSISGSRHDNPTAQNAKALVTVDISAAY